MFTVAILISWFSLARAALYVNEPIASSACYGGQPCTVSWLDDGEQPLLSKIGACYVGLYNGKGLLVQQIEPVNVASAHSLVFTPDPSAGPSAGDYYLNFTSVSLMVNQTSRYTQYSADFALASMSGSLSSPIASDTSALPVPSSVLSPTLNIVESTSTISNSFSSYETISSVTLPSSVHTSSSARLISSRTPSSSVSTASASSSTTVSSAHTSAAIRSRNLTMGPVYLVVLAWILAFYRLLL